MNSQDWIDPTVRHMCLGKPSMRPPNLLPIFDEEYGSYAYQLAEDWEVHTSLWILQLPQGMILDGASVPRLFWLAYPPDGLFRAAQLYAHRCHNLCSGSTFFQDHEFFGKLYPIYEAAYDVIVERIIGLGTEKLDLVAVTEKACKLFAAAAKEDSTTQRYFERLESTEKQLRTALKDSMSGASEGTKNLLQGLCDESEARAYQIKQRRKGS